MWMRAAQQDALENRISMGPQTFSGDVMIWNWRPRRDSSRWPPRSLSPRLLGFRRRSRAREASFCPRSSCPPVGASCMATVARSGSWSTSCGRSPNERPRGDSPLNNTSISVGLQQRDPQGRLPNDDATVDSASGDGTNRFNDTLGKKAETTRHGRHWPWTGLGKAWSPLPQRRASHDVRTKQECRRIGAGRRRTREMLHSLAKLAC